MSRLQVDQVHDRNPWTSLDVDDPAERWSFVLLSDRTGAAQPGVFQSGLKCTDLLAPAFAVQVGDMIEGYVTDADELDRQWDEIDHMLTELETPLFHVAGNHDVSNTLMHEKWIRRYGRTYYHFRYDDALFLVVDTQDPPGNYGEEKLREFDELEYQIHFDPAQAIKQIERSDDWQHAALVSDEQLSYFESVLAQHGDAKWLFLLMHMPLWQGENPAWARLRAAIGDRPYSAFAGHVHNYKATYDGPSAQVRLGSTGGAWVLSGPDGNIRHVTQVTVTKHGPVVANVLLDGLRDIDGLPPRPVAMTLVPAV